MADKKILDWSNFTGIPSADKINQLKTDGWEAVILGTQFPNITRAQYQACLANNFTVEALYLFVYWDIGDGVRVLAASQLASEFNLNIWLDCEWGKTGFPGTGTWAPPATELLRLIHLYKEELGTKYAGIYTGRWWWVPFTQDSHDFSSDPLWHAAYSPPDFAHFVSYGGWLQPTIWQYSSQGVDGVNADLDIERVPTPMPPPDDPNLPARIFIYGNEDAGLEHRGNQQITWNKGVEVDALGDIAGLFPGQHWHNQAGEWIKVLP